MMKLYRTLCATLLLAASASQAQISIPGADGSDGSLQITENTVIDLSQAPTAVWDAPSSSVGTNGSNAGNGVYDPDKWAVVFKYSSVTVDPGVTLSFINHPSRAPVVWLVSGDVSIDGVVSVNGRNWVEAPAIPEPGPGGFRGGMGTFATGVTAGAGFGPGGGQRFGNSGYAGSYGTVGTNGNSVRYGNQSLIPLLGGSGGGSDPDRPRSGGSGAGAILIASAGTIAIEGTIRANGGSGYFSTSGTDWNSSGGSGGGIRLVAETLSGAGIINALGGGGWQVGGLGRIRIERVINANTLQVNPDASLIDLPPASTALIWPPSDAPTVRILSVGGETVGSDPRASFGTTGADVVLPEVTSTQILVETENVEEASEVFVRVTPRANAGATTVTATVDSVQSTDPLVVRWIADLPVITGYSAVQVRVVRP